MDLSSIPPGLLGAVLFGAALVGLWVLIEETTKERPKAQAPKPWVL